MAVRQRGTYKNGDPRWICQWVDSAGADHIATYRTKGAAKDREAKERGDKKAGVQVSDSKETVAKAAEKWISAVAAGRKDRGPAEASTLRQCRYHVDKYIVPALGPVKLSKLTKATVIRFKEDLLKTVSDKTKKEMSRALAKKVLTSLKDILNEAIHRERLAVNVATSVHVGISRRGNGKVAIPAKKDITTLLDKLDELATDTRWRRRRAMMAVAIHAGLRASELRGLPWSSFDRKTGTLEITQRADEKGEIGEPKSESGHRTIHIPPALVTMLKEWQAECPARSTLVFPVGEDRPESLANIFNRCWIPLLKAARVKRFNFHALRHFHASLLIDAGANPKEVMVEMGHSSIQITYDLYGHLFTDEEADKRRAERAERMAGKLKR